MWNPSQNCTLHIDLVSREITDRTCNPALEDLETGFFLSLSLFAAVVFAAKRPFPPFPAISLFFEKIEKPKQQALGG